MRRMGFFQQRDEIMRKRATLLTYTVLIICLTSAVIVDAEDTKFRTFKKGEILEMENKRAVISTIYGDITLKFYPEVAPNHVQSFLELAEKGFFDGTVFHRVVPGFVIQGGDPLSKNPDRSLHGTGGPGFQLKAEFSDKPHKRGTLSMARSASPDSAGSQFFICVAEAAFLDGQYTAFGEVTSGMEVVDKIVSQPRDERDNPLDRIEMTITVTE
jgi:peptidyl-prolyl cis-trans isomerase B (cyclophilin B)